MPDTLLGADKGYHSGAVVLWVQECEVGSYIPERKQTGERNWEGKEPERLAVFANQERVQGEYGKELLRKRGELVERSFAHCYQTGGMRRCTLRGNKNILKRLLIHVGAFNLSLILRKTLGAGTPRELKNRAAELALRLFWLLTCPYRPHRTGEPRIGHVIATQNKNRSEISRCRNLWNLRTCTTGGLVLLCYKRDTFIWISLALATVWQ